MKDFNDKTNLKYVFILAGKKLDKYLILIYQVNDALFEAYKIKIYSNNVVMKKLMNKIDTKNFIHNLDPKYHQLHVSDYINKYTYEEVIHVDLLNYRYNLKEFDGISINNVTYKYNENYNILVAENGKTIIKNYDKLKFIYCNLSLNGNGYYQTMIKRKLHKVSALVYETYNGKIDQTLVIDHIDNNPKNNHYTNLQQITIRKNSSKDKSNIFTGASFRKDRNVWISTISISVDSITYILRLGSFKTAEEAHIKYEATLPYVEQLKTYIKSNHNNGKNKLSTTLIKNELIKLQKVKSFDKFTYENNT